MPDEKLARAIRSKVRRDMLHILAMKPKCPVHLIAEELVITESTASKHLKLLHDLGILEFHDEGKERFYSLRVIEIKELLEVYDLVIKKL
ncbi:MAG: helix-turn-helix domain-containing protein [Nanoarchaeota archaeon]|nr:helix-turn-helix domain-containing protein [Nanoarchaeota archaeon]